ncbi:MAG: chromosome segregation protein SMC, partial [Candidatus Hydrogenedentes bacterium]|nr:chromosome segregation protein SMC [Candidatus Hydrogenedentota bacterium]
MHFKQIELCGFKSFADRTVFNLEDGMTAVVGPNGCGKSNILDAMRWALGEQRPKELRGTHMQDIIFNGSDNRAAMGMSEVTLTFDNSDGTLPIDFAEVQVTRRLFRSGESDYLINKAPCRLRDVQELFMDTGIGTNAYSMIGQGKISMVLSSRPEDRRFLFDEAAGIIKYKSRKRIAMRKLDQAEQNLLRLGDIIGEIERQKRSLKRQVNAAIRHRELTDRLRDFEVRASWLKQQELTGRLDGLKKQFLEAKDGYEKMTAEAGRLEATHEESSLAKLEIDRLLHARREAVHEIDTEMEQIERQVALIRQQINFSTEQQQRAVQEKETLDGEAKQIRLQRQEAETRIEALQDEQTSAERVLLTQQLGLEAAANNVTTTAARLEEQRAKSVELMQTRAQTQTAIDTLSVNLSNIEEQRGLLDRKQKREGARILELDTLLNEKRRIESEKSHALAAAQTDLEQAQEEERRLQRELDYATRDWHGLREQKSSAEARLESYRELRDSYDGFAEGVLAIMQAKNDQRQEALGILGPIGDLISTSDHYRRAVEAALGGHLSSIVIERAGQAQEAIRFLRDRRAGRVTFLPLNTIQPNEGHSPAAPSGLPGLIAPLMNVIDFDERLRPIAFYLLRDAVLVETMDHALQIAAQLRPCPLLVTLAGELLDPSGAMTGGETGEGSHGILGRTARIEETQELLQQLDADVSRAAHRIETLTAEKLHGAQRATESAAALETHSLLALAEVALQITQIDTESEKLAQSTASLGGERDALKVKYEEFTHQKNESLETAASVEIQALELERHLTAALADAHAARQAQSQLANQLADLRVQSAQLSKSIDETERDRARHQDEHERTAAEIDKRAAAIDEFAANRLSLENDTKELLKRSKDLAESKEQARKKVVEAENQRQNLIEEADALEKELKTVREQAQQTQTQVHKTEIDLRHDEDQLQFFQERILSEYGIALSSLTLEDVGVDEHDDKERDRIIGETRERLDRIGTVNLMAIEEYEALSERHEFLVAQDQDLQAARDMLLGVVKRIDTTIKEMFLETFNAVAENFREYFRRLFNGGQARIYLIDEDDPLETGIEIEARPPGKKPQSISLLSGGEQALTAIALLFGIFKAKPSPFCVLDEVDAPLDDANIGRFVELVDEFSANTQFVVITHNKQTMAKAGTLYGVTQQERGVSQIVSVRFDE